MDYFCVDKGVVFLDTRNVGLVIQSIHPSIHPYIHTYIHPSINRFIDGLVCICSGLFVILKEVVERFGGFQFFFCVI